MKNISFYAFLTISLFYFPANSQTWSSIGPEGGWVDHIAYHPTQHTTMYASGDTHGGIYKSTDGGNTWNNLSGYGCYNAWSFEIHPTRPDTIYAGSMMNEIDSVGLRVSIDGGLTWQTTLKWPSISQIAVHPTNPNIVFAAAGYWPGYQTNTHGEGLWKSIDGGFTWNKIVTGLIDNMSVQSIVINPSNPNAMHVGVWGVFGNGKGMYASLDGGNTWFAAGLANKDVWKVAICSNSANVLYAATQDSVYKSVDYGSTWNKMNIASNVFQGLYFGISISKSNNNVVYVGSLDKGMFKTTDGGTTWSCALNSGLSATRIWEVTCHPTNTNEVFCGQQGTGIWKTTNGATQWQSSNTGFKCTYISDLHYNSSGLYAALYNEAGNNYASIKKWGGSNWSSIGLNDTWVGKITSVPNATNILFATKTDAGFFASPSNRLMRSNNAGSNWYHTGVGIDTTVEIKVIKIDVSNSNTMYAGNAKGFYKSIDGGNTFTLTGLNNLNVTSIVVSSTSSNVIYAGTWSGVYTSTNSGLNWTALPTFSIPIFCLAQLPSSSQTLLAGTYGAGILKSTDAGASWNNVATNLLGKVIQCLLVDPSNSTTIYAGGEMGVYVSTSQGNTGTWTDFSTGMNTYKSKIMNLEVDMSTGNLYAGTLGYGAFTRNIFITTALKNDAFQNELKLYPMPTKGRFTIRGSEIKNYSYEIINIQGEVVSSGKIAENTSEINMSGISNGIYFLKCEGNNMRYVKKIIISQ